MRNSPSNVYSYPHDEAKPTGAIAQTTQYNVPRWLTGVELFFRRKHATRGVVVEMRNVTPEGFPGSTVLTSRYVPSSEIKVSNNASLGTKVTFLDPVWMRSDEPIAIVVQLDTASSYEIWQADTGSTDITTGATIAGGNLGRGSMYLPEVQSVLSQILVFVWRPALRLAEEVHRSRCHPDRHGLQAAAD
jgi:hypothetical protein